MIEKEIIRAVLVDDEEHGLETLAWKLEKCCPEVEIAGRYTDPDSALERLRTDPPDLLFLDIEMPLLDGFQFLDALGGAPCPVIFVTAHTEFGIRAIKHGAVDYLVKPVQVDELRRALDTYRTRVGDIQAPPSDRAAAIPPRISLSTMERIEFVEPDEIVVCVADRNYTRIHLTGDRERMLSRTLKGFEDALTPWGFFRTHHSHLVNLIHVREFVRSEGGYLVLSNGMQSPVARNRREELLGRLAG